MRVYAKDNLRTCRIKKGFSVTGLAKESGMSRQYLHGIEKNTYSIGPEKAKSITDALGVGFDEVFEIVESE